MRAIPNSSAMDMAAHGGGPTSRVLPWIVGGEPQQILTFITELSSAITKLAGIMNGVENAGGALRQAWPTGTAADGAATKLNNSIALFTRITTAVEAMETEIRAAATALQLVQNAYTAVVGSTNPTVAVLLSNIHTRPAATSLSVQATTQLGAFVSSTKATLDAIGQARLAAIATSLATIASELESLLSGS
jgi:hypothetical protein